MGIVPEYLFWPCSDRAEHEDGGFEHCKRGIKSFITERVSCIKCVGMNGMLTQWCQDRGGDGCTKAWCIQFTRTVHVSFLTQFFIYAIETKAFIISTIIINACVS